MFFLVSCSAAMVAAHHALPAVERL